MGACATKSLTQGSPPSNSIDRDNKKFSNPTTTAAAAAAAATPHHTMAPSSSDDVQEFELKKRRPGCTGMFWRSDPTGKTSLASNDNWPRDGAKLRGHVIREKGDKWLLVTHVKQLGDTAWKEAPKGAAMPFEYNRHYYLG